MKLQHINSLRVLSIVLMLSACGDERRWSGGNGSTKQPLWENRTPTINHVAPELIRVGEEVAFIGSQFLTRTEGSVMLIFDGEFRDQEGQTHKVETVETQAKVLSQARLSWRLWPDVVFAPDGRSIGEFTGTVTAVNQGKDGTDKYSAPENLRFQIQPSIILAAMRPVREGCKAVVEGTYGDMPMGMSVSVIGLQPASTTEKLKVSWTFQPSQWNIEYGYGNVFNTESILPNGESVTFIDEITSGTESAIGGLSEKHLALQVGKALVGRGKNRITKLNTAKLPQNSDTMLAQVFVHAEDASGESTRLTIPVLLRAPAWLENDGVSEIAQRMEPTLVSNCTSGNPYGVDIRYSESQSEELRRSMSFNWNANLSITVAPQKFIPLIGKKMDSFAFQATMSAGFSVDVNDSVSSSSSENLDLSGHVLPGDYASFYRQTTKIHRIGRMRAYTACGEERDLGDALLTDWIWTPDLARGPTCPPPSNLPPAETFREDGDRLF